MRHDVFASKKKIYVPTVLLKFKTNYVYSIDVYNYKVDVNIII